MVFRISKIADPSVVMKVLKQRVGRRLLRNGCRRPGQLEMFVFTNRKRIEKLKYMHRNPVKRGLVERPEDWIWSSFNAYSTETNYIVNVDLMF